MLYNQFYSSILPCLPHSYCYWIICSPKEFMAYFVFFFDRKVISEMRVLMTEDSNNAVSSSFLLDDDSRLKIRL